MSTATVILTGPRVRVANAIAKTQLVAAMASTDVSPISVIETDRRALIRQGLFVTREVGVRASVTIVTRGQRQADTIASQLIANL